MCITSLYYIRTNQLNKRSYVHRINERKETIRVYTQFGFFFNNNNNSNKRPRYSTTVGKEQNWTLKENKQTNKLDSKKESIMVNKIVSPLPLIIIIDRKNHKLIFFKKKVNNYIITNWSSLSFVSCSLCRIHTHTLTRSHTHTHPSKQTHICVTNKLCATFL